MKKDLAVEDKCEYVNIGAQSASAARDPAAILVDVKYENPIAPAFYTVQS